MKTMNGFTVPWKREGTSSQKYRVIHHSDKTPPYVEGRVDYLRKNKKQSMTMWVVFNTTKPAKYNELVKELNNENNERVL